jgi:Ca2+-binding RTX toxin-like protein
MNSLIKNAIKANVLPPNSGGGGSVGPVDFLVVSPVAIGYTDTAVYNIFSSQSGHLVVSASSPVTFTMNAPTSYGYHYGWYKSTNPNYGTLYFSTSGDYEFVPDIQKINTLGINQSFLFTVTANSGTLNTNTTIVITITQSGATETNGHDNLIGTGGNDLIKGLNGNDTLTGSLGKDTLTGGAGSDMFKFNFTFESGLTIATRDVITDFEHSLDKINLSGIDANSASPVNDAFSSITYGIVSGGFSFINSGELYFNTSTHILYGNTDAILSTAEFSIELLNVTNVAGDIIL